MPYSVSDMSKITAEAGARELPRLMARGYSISARQARRRGCACLNGRAHRDCLQGPTDQQARTSSQLCRHSDAPAALAEQQGRCQYTGLRIILARLLCGAEQNIDLRLSLSPGEKTPWQRTRLGDFVAGGVELLQPGRAAGLQRRQAVDGVVRQLQEPQ